MVTQWRKRFFKERLAASTLQAAGDTVLTSDLYRMRFGPVSSRSNFVSVKDADYLKLQAEEIGQARLLASRPMSKPRSPRSRPRI